MAGMLLPSLRIESVSRARFHVWRADNTSTLADVRATFDPTTGIWTVTPIDPTQPAPQTRSQALALMLAIEAACR
ncbi:MAG: hypothetical protein OXN91_00470 [Chloroflexota bacterium]|nr:hypothetical protein [Chloroflexota bacterium]